MFLTISLRASLSSIDGASSNSKFQNRDRAYNAKIQRVKNSWRIFAGSGIRTRVPTENNFMKRTFFLWASRPWHNHYFSQFKFVDLREQVHTSLFIQFRANRVENRLVEIFVKIHSKFVILPTLSIVLNGLSNLNRPSGAVWLRFGVGCCNEKNKHIIYLFVIYFTISSFRLKCKEFNCFQN